MSTLPVPAETNGINHVPFRNLPDIRHRFKEKLQPLLADYPHLNLSVFQCNEKVWRAGGGSGEVYCAYLYTHESVTWVALKQIRTILLIDEKFAKVAEHSVTGRPLADYL